MTTVQFSFMPPRKDLDGLALKASVLLFVSVATSIALCVAMVFGDDDARYYGVLLPLAIPVGAVFVTVRVLTLVPRCSVCNRLNRIFSAWSRVSSQSCKAQRIKHWKLSFTVINIHNKNAEQSIISSQLESSLLLLPPQVNWLGLELFCNN